MNTEIIKGILSLVLGLGYIILAPYFLYAILWWFPVIFIGGLINGENFKKNNWDFLSPFIIVQMMFPENRKVQIIIGLVTVALSAVGVYSAWNDNSPFFIFCAAFIGIITSLGIVLSFRKKHGKEYLDEKI